MRKRQGFDEASRPLGGRIEDPVHAHRVIETIAEGAVVFGIGPIRNRSSVVISADAKKRLRGPLQFEIHEFAPNRRQGKLARLP